MNQDALFESNEGFNTRMWGPAMWHILHMISMNYPVRPSEADKQHYFEFITSLQHVLPCGKCRSNLTTNLQTFSLERDLASRHSFARFIYQLHLRVNWMLNKNPPIPVGFDELRLNYEKFRAYCPKNDVPQKSEEGCTAAVQASNPKLIMYVVPSAQTNAPSFVLDVDC